MTLETKKDYILKFMAQGISEDKSYDMTYCTEEEIDAIEKDEGFQETIKVLKLDLSLQNLESYNRAVKFEGRPVDHLKRLSVLSNVVDEEIDDEMSANIKVNIIKQRG